jgi:hypothetical protein
MIGPGGWDLDRLQPAFEIGIKKSPRFSRIEEEARSVCNFQLRIDEVKQNPFCYIDYIVPDTFPSLQIGMD